MPLREIHRTLSNVYEANPTEDPDYVDIIGALKSRTLVSDTPPNHPARGIEYIWNQLSISQDDTFAVVDSNKILVPKSDRQAVLELSLIHI